MGFIVVLVTFVVFDLLYIRIFFGFWIIFMFLIFYTQTFYLVLDISSTFIQTWHSQIKKLKY